MTFQFTINMARADVERARLVRVRLRVTTVCCFVFGLLLLATFSVYLKRNGRVQQLQDQMRVYAKSCEDRGITKIKLATMREDTQRFEDDLEALKQIVRESTSWSRAIAAISACCSKRGVSIREIEGGAHGQAAFMRVGGVCSLRDAVWRIAQLKRDAAALKNIFGSGRVVSIRRDEKTPQAIFDLEIPLVSVPPSKPKAVAGNEGAP